MHLENVSFLLTGGITRKFGKLLGHGHGSKYCELARLSWGDKKIETLIKHQTKNDFCADLLPSHYFTSASLYEDKLYLCSTTQVFIYSYPDLKLIKELNHPYFNDLHHVTKINGNVYVASTGLDSLLIFDDKYKFIDIKHVLGKDVWYRRKNDIDYRKIASTKPHDSHPNFIFPIEDQIWVTRFEQKDAVNIDNMSENIPIDVERIHDGHVIGDKIYFTSVNGCIVIVNTKDKQVEEIVNLNDIDKRGLPLGWCRGLAVLGDYAFVGFSKLRPTNIEKNIRWLKSMGGKKNTDTLPARIAQYDLKNKKLIDEYSFSEKHMSVIFSILLEP